MSDIIKVQVQLVSSKTAGPVLIYAKGRKNVTQQPITDYLLEKMRGRQKAFFYGHYSSTVGWTVNDEAPWQDW